MATRKKAKKPAAVRNLKPKRTKTVKGGKAGKPSPGTFNFTHVYDKASPVI
jgi:type VI protein secretion system component Hcp